MADVTMPGSAPEDGQPRSESQKVNGESTGRPSENSKSSVNSGGTSSKPSNNHVSSSTRPAAAAAAIPVAVVDGSPPKLKSILPGSSDCVYTSCYCEENVWKLCENIRANFTDEMDFCHVAFISNPKRMVPMWRQKAGKDENKCVLWDYHVILLYNPDERCVVYDMDSDLPFPTHFHKYVTETFRTENILEPEYHRFFRVIPATRFLSMFSSDRRHMRRGDGSWTKEPPSYPPIVSEEEHNLDRFLEMTMPSNEYGDRFNLMELVRRFYKPRQLS